MKQRLVLKFDTFYDDYNSTSKAMNAVVSADGVTSVILDEKDESKMVVIGEEMDAYGLLNILKKSNLKAHMESLKEIKHEQKEHHGKDKKKEHHKKEEEEKNRNKDRDRKKKKEKKDKKKHAHAHAHSDSDSDSGSDSSSGSNSSSSSDSESDSDKKKRGHHHNRSSWSSSSGSRSDSDSDKKNRGHHHNQRTYIYQPTNRPQIYPALAPYDEGYNYNYPTSRY